VSVEVKTFFLQTIVACLLFVGCAKPYDLVSHVEIERNASIVPVLDDKNISTLQPIVSNQQDKKNLTFEKSLSKKTIVKPIGQPTKEIKGNFVAKNETLQLSTLSRGALEPKKLKDIGPSDWTVNDIIKKIKYGKIPEKDVVEHIMNAKAPYKKFNYDEIQIMLKCGLSYKIINSMIVVSK
jgi:hypothetical protein